MLYFLFCKYYEVQDGTKLDNFHIARDSQEGNQDEAQYKGITEK